jgi:hypothetical protein
VSIGSQGHGNHAAALASRWASPLLALKIPPRGRPATNLRRMRALIWQMSIHNRFWGAPHIHGELLKLGFAVAQSTVGKYMAETRDRLKSMHRCPRKRRCRRPKTCTLPAH